MSWWDYGHFIMQLAHRIPNANPTQTGAVEAGQFFTALNESSANEVADERGTKYVMIDFLMATSKFYAMARWAGKSENDFFQIYYAPVSSDAVQPVQLYYSTYYNSTVVRLYNFDGRAAVPSVNSTIAISWQQKTGRELLGLGISFIVVSQDRAVRIDEGSLYNIIVNYRFFSSLEEAETYVSTQQSGNYDVGGMNPFATIVPLEPLNSYERVYPVAANTTINPTTVKIFKYLGPGGS
jgi:asparagine N-glycosylation enzyme membrane subunit Stt3